MLAFYDPCAFVQLPRLNSWDPVGVIQPPPQPFRDVERGGSRGCLRRQDEQKKKRDETRRDEK